MNTTELNTLRYQAFDTASRHGYHAEECRPAFWLGLVVSECGECIHADREDRHATESQYYDVSRLYVHQSLDAFREAFEKEIKNTVEDAFADIIIRLLDFAGNYHIQLEYDPTVYSEEEIDDIRAGDIPTIMFVLTGYLTSVFHIMLFNSAFEKIYNTGEALFGEDLWKHVKLKMAYNRCNMTIKKY